jgi:hypothetical protein
MFIFEGWEGIPMMQKKRFRLTIWIFAGFFLGILAGAFDR